MYIRVSDQDIHAETPGKTLCVAPRRIQIGPAELGLAGAPSKFCQTHSATDLDHYYGHTFTLWSLIFSYLCSSYVYTRYILYALSPELSVVCRYMLFTVRPIAIR